MFYTYVFTVITLIYSIDLYKTHFPNEYNIIITKILANIQQNEKLIPYLPFLTKICYNIIYAYSFCQVTLNKTIQFVGPYLKTGVKNVHSRILCNINITNPFTIVNANSKSNFVLIKSPTPKNDMIILDKVPDSLDNIIYETSSPHFLSLYLKTESNYNIELSSDSMNFYVVGNIFNANFFKYYLQNVLNVVISNDISNDISNENQFTYKLELMDHNVSIVYLDETQSILINKDGYEILESSLVKEEIKKEEIKKEEIKKEEIGLDASTICY